MKKLRIPAQLLLLAAGVLSLITLSYDVLEFYTALEIRLWGYIHEALSIAVLILYFLFLKTRSFYSERRVQPNLLLFLKLLASFYIFYLIAHYLLNPSFSHSTFPPQAETLGSVFYAFLLSMAAIIFLTPLLIVIKNLIYYKYKKYTTLYIYIALVSAAVSIFFTVLFEIPLDFQFSGTALFNNIPYAVTIAFSVMLATRNAWVTYLSRKEKYTYFLAVSVVVWFVFLLFDLVINEAVPSYSLALGAFANMAWLFLVFYALFTGLNLMRHIPTARAFDRKMKEVSSLHNLSRTISAEHDLHKLVQKVTDLTSEVIESNYTWLEYLDTDHQKLSVTASTNLDAKKIEELNNRLENQNSVALFSENQTSIVINDTSKESFNHPIVDILPKIGSLVGVPLKNSKGGSLGILFAAKTAPFGFDPDDVNMLEAYANQAAIAIENAYLMKVSLERERMEKELQIAREVQMRLLPQSIPTFGSAEVDTLTITAYEVGGDYFDFYNLSDHRLGVAIGDVSGKGTSAAFYMAETKGIIQSVARMYQSPKEILSETNSILYQSMERKSFISLLAAQFDFKTNVFKFARAGHCPVIYYNAQDEKISVLQPPGIAIGLDSGPIFSEKLAEQHVAMQSGDIFVFYTDGLSEARNRDNEEFGEDRLCDIIRQNNHLTAPELKDAIIDEILRFLDGNNLHDDLTLVLVKIKEK
ncbi:MAG TPA: GAF domain-containing protein [Caldithrix abyssi]|uniref:GAF domain-containing protein n=1 Tax=Caldithrix abyssi TaxID=187145 RepID=A0A7V4U2P7_CALAY|nr:GAF domain-containing protein [Caldithrix abyssi]